jgi:hypothetical protein
MPSCHEMKEGEIYCCETCGLELKVVRKCSDSGDPAAECACHEGEHDPCTFSCCGKELTKK